MRLAVASWELRDCRSWSDFETHFQELAGQASAHAADVLVLPEFCCFELLNMRPDLPEAEVGGWLETFSDAIENLCRFSADWHRMAIVGGSHVKRTEKGLMNVSCVAEPDGRWTLCPKVNLTRYESDVMALAPGSGLPVLADRRLGVTVCYDCEFPESGRALAERGVLVQCVPTFTETIRGHQRVRWCCQARAVENQVFVAMASLVGSLGREPVPETYGSSAVFCPSAEPFPQSAILAETPPNVEGVAVADLDFTALAWCRANGDVRNWLDRHRGVWRNG